jgi:hypothetical protein
MRRPFPDAQARGYDPLAGDMTCDPKDRHVPSAAVRGNAEALITINTRDFPEEPASACDITIAHPGDFLPGLYPATSCRHCAPRAAGYKNPEMGVADLPGRLAPAGITRFAAEARRHL